MIKTGRFAEFVRSVWKTSMQEKEEKASWEYFLHKVFDGSFEDFRKEMKTTNENRTMSEQTIETTLIHTMGILNNFNPEKGGET